MDAEYDVSDDENKDSIAVEVTSQRNSEFDDVDYKEGNSAS